MRTTSHEDFQVCEQECGSKIIATSPLVVDRLQKKNYDSNLLVSIFKSKIYSNEIF